MNSIFTYANHPALTPQKGSPWADTMVLNPAIVRHPGSDTLHMLFRASGPWPQAHVPGKPLPYPIFLGYAVSHDQGHSWDADFSKPALAPMLAGTIDGLYINSLSGKRMVNHANGCIEDPRLVFVEETLYLIVACRLFAPGPYWVHDDPMQCAPGWALSGSHPFGLAASRNVTVSVAYTVDLDRLAARDYGRAFAYAGHLTDPEKGENRDAMLFPERLTIRGRKGLVLVHRPVVPSQYAPLPGSTHPSIMLATAESIEDFPGKGVSHFLLASPRFEWESNRIGASFGPLRISSDEWLLGYHGKQNDIVGYTQSFMILRERADDFPVVRHRCPERMMFAERAWEMPNTFKIPCLFSTGGVLFGNTLVISYGAADEVAGVAWADLEKLVKRVRQYNPDGERIS